MLSFRNVPKHLWPNAVRWAIYGMNRSPTFAIKNKAPEECWNGKNASIHHFKMFGCVANAHVLDTQRKKMDGKSVQCVNLNVSEKSRAYKL